MTTPVYPTTWYFVVGDTNPTTQVYDTAGAAFVANTVAAYQAWVGTIGPGPRQPLTTAIVNAANNGSGLIRITLSTANSPTPTSIYSTGNVRVVQNVGGTTEANGTWTITVIDGTNIDLQGSAFVHAYTSGGVFGGGDVIGTVAQMATLLEQFGLTVFIESITSGWGYQSIISGVNVQLTEPVPFFTDIFASADIVVTLPPVNVTGTSLVPGRPLRFRNPNNISNVTIKDNGGTTRGVLPPFCEIELTNQGNSPVTDLGGNWSVSLLGTQDVTGTNTGQVGLHKVLAGDISRVGFGPTFRFIDTTDLDNMTNPPAKVPIGGTGRTTLTAHGILIGEGTAAINQTAAMSDGQLLVGQTGADPLPKTITGDWTLSAVGAATLASTITAGGPTGDATHVAQITYDAKGRLTAVSSVAISGTPPGGTAGGDLSGTYPNPNLANIPDETTAAGDILFTNKASPTSPASGHAKVYVDSTSLNMAVKNSVGTINHGVQTKASVSHQFLTAISDAGAVTGAQPASTDLSDATAVTAWTPTDQSGAGLVLTNNGSNYCKVGPMIIAQFDVTYPVTANGNAAAISLPVTGVMPAAVDMGLLNASTVRAVAQPTAPNVIFETDSGGGALLTNANLSTFRAKGTIVYF